MENACCPLKIFTSETFFVYHFHSSLQLRGASHVESQSISEVCGCNVLK